MTTLILEFKKIDNDNNTRFNTFYSNLKADTIIGESDIDDVFESIYTTIISNIQTFLGKSTGWIIDSVIDHNINISKAQRFSWYPLYQITKRIRPSKKRLD